MKTRKVKVFTWYEEGKVEKESDYTELDQVVFPEDAAVATVSVGSELPIALAKFLNAKQTVHISVPCYADKSSIANAYKFASEFCEEHLSLKIQEYLVYLDSKGVDYKKIREGIK
jgi:hypothetical protein